MSFIRPELAPTPQELARLKAVAGGRERADLALRGGSVVFVHTGETMVSDVLVAGRHVAAVTPSGRLPMEAASEVDASGFHVLPGYADCHIHMDYTLLPVGELARLVVPRGTTTLYAAPDCSAYAFGRRAIDLHANTQAPIRVFVQTPFAMPAYGEVEQGGEHLSTEDIEDLLRDPRTTSYGESNPYLATEHMLRCYSAALASGRRINGHTARMEGEPLWEYLAGGVTDDHNAATLAEAVERIRRGANLALQSSSMSNYLEGVFTDPESLGSMASHIMFSADDKYADDLASEGHIDHHVRSAVRLGVPAPIAVRMAALNPAIHFRVDHLIGSITPTRLADLQLTSDLVEFRPAAVWVGGERVAEEGRPLFGDRDAPYPDWVLQTMHLGRELHATDFAVRVDGSGRYTVRIAQMYDGYYKRVMMEAMEAGPDGILRPDPDRDIAKAAVVDRHKGTGRIGRAFLRGFGLRSGALAVSTNCANQNVVVVGVSDEECAAAVNRLGEMGGGFVVMEDGRSVAEVPLRYGGTASIEGYERLLEQLASAKAAASALGCAVDSPFMILSFVGLPAVPEVGLTELGLVDVSSQDFVPVVVSTFRSAQ